jgi:hypothetical protein
MAFYVKKKILLDLYVLHILTLDSSNFQLIEKI